MPDDKSQKFIALDRDYRIVARADTPERATQRAQAAGVPGPVVLRERPAREVSGFTGVSLVSFTDEDIRKVAEHAGVPEERVRAYLSNKDDQDNVLLQAFHGVTGCYPIGKFSS